MIDHFGGTKNFRLTAVSKFVLNHVEFIYFNHQDGAYHKFLFFVVIALTDWKKDLW